MIILVGAMLVAVVVTLAWAYSSADTRADEAMENFHKLLTDSLEQDERHKAELELMKEEMRKAAKIIKQLESSDNPTVSSIGELATDGLQTDGGHHKQWYLEEIAKACGVTEEWMDEHVDRGMPA